MSRIGRKPIVIPKGVEVKISEGNVVSIKGPKGTLSRKFSDEMKIDVTDGQILVERPSDEPYYRAIHGTTRALINNMILGVSQGFSKRLIINEKTYKANVNGKRVELSLGYSHPISMDVPDGLTVTVEGQTITVSGLDKELVGAFSQKIRHLRKVDPYKVKGIIYEGERIRRKVGKTVATSK